MRSITIIQPNSCDNHDHFTENFSKARDKFEVNKYTTEMTKSISRTSWFYILYTHSQNKTDSMLPPRLEVVFLLDRSAAISVLKIPILMMITQIFNVCNHGQHDTSTTLTIANQFEAPNKQNVFVTCF